MLVSVIVPIYKVENYIRKCIESILNQTFDDFELILVDDGSPDNCPEICDEYANLDKRIKVIHKSNGGLTSARKAGIAEATGEYVLCVDGDDYIAGDLLERVSKKITDFSCDIVCFGYNTFPNNVKINSISKYREGLYNRKQIEDEIFPTLITAGDGNRFPPSIWSKVVRRELITPIQLVLPDSIILGEDSCISYVSLYKATSCYIMHEELYFYRVENASLTRSKKSFSWKEPILRANFYLEFMSKDTFEEQVARITAHSFFNVAISVFRAKKYREAKKEVKTELSDENVQYFLRKAKFRGNRKEQFAVHCLRRKKVFALKILSVLV